MPPQVSMTPREIKGRRLQRALDHLAAADPDLGRAATQVGAPPPRARPAGFAGLLNILVAQQVSAAAARAIWGRLVAGGPPTPVRFLAYDDARLKAIGLSRQKIAYGRGLAADVAAGRLDLDAVAALDDDAAIAALTRIKGVGRWSAEVYLLFCLQRPDVLPADDLALLVAAQRLKGYEQRPTAAGLRAAAEPWRPWRSVAARLLWHYYSRAPGEASPTAAAAGRPVL